MSYLQALVVLKNLIVYEKRNEGSHNINQYSVGYLHIFGAGEKMEGKVLETNFFEMGKLKRWRKF